MWFMNKIANPFVRIILRSPLHRLLSASVLLISCTGRKSGNEYTFPVQYASHDNTIYIIPGNAGKKTWWRNLYQCPGVKLRLAGKTRTGRAAILENADQLSLITQGLNVYFKRFPPSARIHNVRTDPNGNLNQADIERVARSTVVVCVELDR